MEKHEGYIRQALELARQAMAKGNHPFGALLVHGREVVLTAENTIFTEGDVTRHAELNLISMASRKLPSNILAECTLYTSTEPCAMCAGAIYQAGIAAVVFSCSAESLGRITGGNFVIPCRQIFDRGKRKTLVIGPLLEEESLAIHQIYWQNGP